MLHFIQEHFNALQIEVADGSKQSAKIVRAFSDQDSLIDMSLEHGI
jgi:hypothetical protein